MSNVVTTQPAGNTFEVNDDESILIAAMNNGVNLPYGCGNGFCGACAATLTKGEISYLDNYTADILSDDDKKSGKIICCKATIKSSVSIEVTEIVTAIKPKDFNTKIKSIENVSDNIIILKVDFGDNNHIQYLAGQYVDFIIDGDKKRAFSIADAPSNKNELEFHIKKNPDGIFTKRLFEGHYKNNDSIIINGPLGSFSIQENSTKPMIMVAGGTGFAPIKAMIEDLIAGESTRLIKLYCGVANEEDLYMDLTAQQWADEHENITYIPVVYNADDSWQGEVGHVTDVVASQNPDLAKYEVYLTGPPAMTNAGKESFTKLGLPNDNLYSDSFETGE